MNFSLLDKIDAAGEGILVTVLHTEGHTYQKAGAKSLFAVKRTSPLWGNLGSLCIDQELLRQGEAAWAEGRPKSVEIDTREENDIDFGYGTFCGGLMRLLLEPVTETHKSVYRTLRARLEKRQTTYVAHDLVTGDLRLSDEEPQTRDGVFVEKVEPLQQLIVFGATPLTSRLAKCLEDMDYEFHVVDWRQDHLDTFREVDGVSIHLDEYGFDENSFVLIQSHDFRRDKLALKEALARNCAFIGMLSSSSRREKLFEELRNEGVAAADLERISSPVGLDIGARSDPEIATAIAAELVEFKNK